MILGKLICRFVGHRWRRLTKKERGLYADKRADLQPPSPQMRRCARCGAERIVKARKANPKPKTGDTAVARTETTQEQT